MSLGALWKVMLVSAGLAAAAYLIAHAVMFLMGGSTLPYFSRSEHRASPHALVESDEPASPDAIVASGLFGQPAREGSSPPEPGPGLLPAATGLPACGGRLVGIVV